MYEVTLLFSFFPAFFYIITTSSPHLKSHSNMTYFTTFFFIASTTIISSTLLLLGIKSLLDDHNTTLHTRKNISLLKSKRSTLKRLKEEYKLTIEPLVKEQPQTNPIAKECAVVIELAQRLIERVDEVSVGEVDKNVIGAEALIHELKGKKSSLTKELQSLLLKVDSLLTSGCEVVGIKRNDSKLDPDENDSGKSTVTATTATDFEFV